MRLAETYPSENLFFSREWEERARVAAMPSGPYAMGHLRSLRLAIPVEGEWSDLERWPDAESVGRRLGALRAGGVDWVVHRKLLAEQRPAGAEAFYETEYSVAPYLDLTRPLQPKKEVIAHIHRTERKITREIGPLRLRRAESAAGREDWFERWSALERGSGRLDARRLELFRRWVLSGELPGWMRLLSLTAEPAVGGAPIDLAHGLFYVWKGVFYYYAPVMSPDPALRKYGPGKLFVQKLIESARAEGCEVFDFLQGEHEYKLHWNPEIRRLRQCIVPVSAKGRLALAAFRARRWIRNRAGGARG